MKIELDLKKTAFENAGGYFNRSKKYKRKLAGAKTALKKFLKTKPKIEKVETTPLQKPQAKNWYDKFRWFRTSDDFLVVLGKDATTNELLVKKHTEKHDLVFHADIQGAPFAVIKTEGKQVPESTLNQTAQFAASFSKAWARGLGTIDIYYITPDQVSKTPPPGEYLPKGAFMIYGNKTYLKPQLQIAFGNKDGELVWGTPESVSLQTSKNVTLIPGSEKAADLSKKIADILGLETVDQIQRLIPSSKGKILK